MKNKLKEYRQKAELSQEKLARLVDTALGNIQKIENKESEPLIGLAWRLKKVLGVELEELFDLKEDK